MSKMISNLIERRVILELRIRGPRIKNSARWMKLIERLPSPHKIFPVPLNFLIDEDRQVAFLNMPKVAGTSLMRTLLESEAMRQGFDRARNEHKEIHRLGRINWLVHDEEASAIFPINMKTFQYRAPSWFLIGPDKDTGFERKEVIPKDINSFFIFTFVRNPFSRFVSLFQDKYRYEKLKHKEGRYYSNLDVFFWLHEVSSFEDLAHKVSRLPDFHLDEHAAPQHLKCDSLKAMGIEIDFIGKFETVARDFEKLQTRFNLLPLDHHNASEGQYHNWRDYYTPKTAEMVYQRYSKDFEVFGYEDEYPKLLDYLNNKAKMRTLS